MARVACSFSLSGGGSRCGNQGYHKTRVHDTGDDDDLARWIFLNGQNYGGLTGDGELIESEEDGEEESSGLLIGIGLEVRTDINDESRADGREQTHLREQVR